MERIIKKKKTVNFIARKGNKTTGIKYKRIVRIGI